MKIVSLVKAFPAISGYEDTKGLICINIKEGAIHDIIERQRDAGEDLVVLAPDGHLVTETSSGTSSHNELDSVFDDQRLVANRIIAVSGVKSMVSYRTISTNNWKIINITPIKDFRRNLVRIRLMVVLICSASIVLGLIVTIMFSARMYNPLRVLVDRLGELAKGKTDEYTLINHALDSLTDQVNTLEHTLAENSPLIRHNVVSGLIRHRIATEEELDNRLTMLNYAFELPYYYAALVDIASFSGGQRTLQDSQSAKYNLIKIFENYDYEGSRFLATDVSDHEIALIINSRFGNLEFQIQALRSIIGGIFKDTDRHPVTTVGSCVGNPLEIHTSFDVVEQVRKYSFFLPAEKYLDGDRLLVREASSRTFEDSSLSEFAEALKLNKSELVTNCLDHIVAKMKGDDYSYDHRYRQLVDMVSIFTDYTKELGIVLESVLASTPSERFQGVAHIDEFRIWMANLIVEAFDYQENRSKNKNFAAIEAARKYVVENIESNHFLDSVAAQVVLKPQYFSKLLKEFKGSSFSTFVNAHKMKHSARLLLTRSGIEILFVTAHSSPPTRRRRGVPDRIIA